MHTKDNKTESRPHTEKKCNDNKCPIHGSVKLRGNVFSAKVLSAKVPKNAIVGRELTKYVKKYERYKKLRSRLRVHNPQCINAMAGDTVQIAETRKLSKTKSFVITKVLEREK